MAYNSPGDQLKGSEPSPLPQRDKMSAQPKKAEIPEKVASSPKSEKKKVSKKRKK